MPKLSNWMLLWHGVSRIVAKKNTQITQVDGSMKAKKFLDMLKDIEDKKEQQAKSREEALKKKQGAKEAFL